MAGQTNVEQTILSVQSTKVKESEIAPHQAKFLSLMRQFEAALLLFSVEIFKSTGTEHGNLKRSYLLLLHERDQAAGRYAFRVRTRPDGRSLFRRQRSIVVRRSGDPCAEKSLR